jgi:hypothetical protein
VRDISMPLLGLFLMQGGGTPMNAHTDSTPYRLLAKELYHMLGYDIAKHLQQLEISELAKLRESLGSMEVYMLSDEYKERMSHG